MSPAQGPAQKWILDAQARGQEGEVSEPRGGGHPGPVQALMTLRAPGVPGRAPLMPVALPQHAGWAGGSGKA